MHQAIDHKDQTTNYKRSKITAAYLVERELARVEGDEAVAQRPPLDRLVEDDVLGEDEVLQPVLSECLKIKSRITDKKTLYCRYCFVDKDATRTLRLVHSSLSADCETYRFLVS